MAGSFLELKIKEIIVVEGRDDVRAVKAAVDAECITTSGLGLNDEIMKTIKTGADRKGIIIFTDPDYPGDKIRKMVKAVVPDAKEAFLKREDAINPKTGKFGIEFASPASIIDALKNAKVTINSKEEEYTWDDMIHYGLTGVPDSGALREYLSDFFGIGHANGKQFLKKINAFDIKRSELEEKIREWLENNENK